MASYVIEEVPVTPREKYPFDEMEVGQSFVFPRELLKKVRGASRAYGVKNGMRFYVTSKAKDGSCRCGRVA